MADEAREAAAKRRSQRRFFDVRRETRAGARNGRSGRDNGHPRHPIHPRSQALARLRRHRPKAGREGDSNRLRRRHRTGDALAGGGSSYRKKLNIPRDVRGAFDTKLPSLDFAADKLASVLSDSRAAFVNAKGRRADLQLLAKWLEAGLKVPLAAIIPVRDVAQGLAKLRQAGGRIAVRVDGGL